MKYLARIISTILIIAALVQGKTFAQETNAVAVDTTITFWDKERADIDSLIVDLEGKAVTDSAEFSKLKWYKQLLRNGFRIHDPRVNYPKFMRYALKLYDWGDNTFNRYDKEYVVGTGKNWKLTTNNYNWMESYMLLFSIHSKDMLHIRSAIHNDLGLHISFMAISIGYTAKIDSWAGAKVKRSNFNFNFTTSRFSANIDLLSSEGDARITHFGRYEPPTGSLNYHFNDIKHEATSGEFYYFLNHLKYSQAAAYCYSKYQIKSAGSPIVGFAFNNQRIDMNFSSLPEEMKEYLPSLSNIYRFRYADYAVLAGYGHNWVLYPRRWLINLTAIPSVGFRHSYSGSSEGSKNMLAANFRARFSLVYNYRAVFASLNGRIDANLFFNSRYAFFNSTESLSLIVGMRF